MNEHTTPQSVRTVVLEIPKGRLRVFVTLRPFREASVAWMERERNPGWNNTASYSPDFTLLHPGYGVVVDPDLP